MNLKTGMYDRDLLKLFGLEEIYDKLLPLRRSADVCGYVTRKASEECGLLEGTPGGDTWWRCI